MANPAARLTYGQWLQMQVDDDGTRELVEVDRGAGRRLGQCRRRGGAEGEHALDSTAMPSRARSRSSLVEPWLPLPDGYHRCVQNRLSMSLPTGVANAIRIARVSDASRRPQPRRRSTRVPRLGPHPQWHGRRRSWFIDQLTGTADQMPTRSPDGSRLRVDLTAAFYSVHDPSAGTVIFVRGGAGTAVVLVAITLVIDHVAAAGWRLGPGGHRRGCGIMTAVPAAAANGIVSSETRRLAA